MSTMDTSHSDTMYTPQLAGADTAPPSVTVNRPNGGEIFKPGDVVRIQWTSVDNVGVVAHDVLFSPTGEQPFEPIPGAQNLPGWQTYFDWTVPNRLTNNARIRVVARDAAGNQAGDRSDGTFKIQDISLFIFEVRPASIPVGAVSTLKVKGQNLLPPSQFSVVDLYTGQQPVYGVYIQSVQGMEDGVNLVVNVSAATPAGTYLLLVLRPGVGSAQIPLTLTASKGKEYKEGKEKEKDIWEGYPPLRVPPGQPMAAVEDRLTRLEADVQQMRHFIGPEARPDLHATGGREA